MALISAKDYLSSKGQPSSDNPDSPSSGGLISAKDYLQKYKPVTPSEGYSLDGKPPAAYNPMTDLGSTDFTPHVPVPYNSPTTIQPSSTLPVYDKYAHLGSFELPNPTENLDKSPLLSHFAYSAGKAMNLPDDMMSADKSTGNSLLDKAVGFAGGTAGYLTNPAQIEQNVGNTFFNNPIAEGAGNKLSALANSALAKLTGSDVSKTLESRLLNKSLQGAAQIGVGSAAYAPFQTLNNGGDIQDIPKNMLDQGLQGAAFGAAMGGAGVLGGAGLKAIASKFSGTKLGDAINGFFGTSQPAESNGQLALPAASDATIAEYNRRNGNVLPTNTDPIYGQGDIHTFALPESPQYNEIQRIKAQQTLGLPEAQAQTMADYNRRNGNVLPTNETPIYGQGDIHTFGLPEPKLSEPTTARRAASNGSLNLYDQLYQEVNSQVANGEIKPVDNQGYANLQQAIEDGYKNGEISHEDYTHMRSVAEQELSRQQEAFNENVKSTYSRIAPKDAPPLDKLINEAYPTKKPLTSDLIQRAKENQRMRGVVGLNPLVKSLDQRYTEANNGNRLGATGNVAMPANKVGVFGRVRPEIKPRQAEPFQETPQQTMQRAAQQLKEAADRKRISDLSKPIIGRAALPETKVGFAPKPLEKGKALNADAKLPQPIKLTPKQIAKNERAGNFSRIEDNPIIPNTSDQIQSKTGKQSIPFADRANDAYIKLVDNQHRTNQFDQAAKDANGGELKPTDSAYTLALNARGHDMQASQIVNKNLIDAQGNVIGQSLGGVTHQIPKDQRSAFDDYVVAKNAIDRMKDGQKVYRDELNMTVQKAKVIVDRYDEQYPHFAEIAKDYTKFSRDFGQAWFVDTGMFKQSQWDAATEARPNYVPNQRIFSDLEKNSQYGSKGGITGQSNPVKKAEGSQRQIISPFESSIENVGKGVKTAKMNEAGQAIVRSLQRNPEELKGFAEIVHDQPKFEIDQLLKEEGPEGVIDHINKTFEDATRKPDLDKGNVVTVLMHGEPVHIRIHDPQFLEAVSNLNPRGQDYVTNLVGKGTKVMKTLTTGVNPVFGLTRNISRDIPHAFISSKTTSNPIRFGADLVDAMTSVLADSMSHSKMTPDFMKGWLETRGSLYNDYKNMGGGHSSPISADRNLLAQSKEKILPSGGIGQTLKRNLITKPYHVLENINNAAEAAPRLGEYKRVVKQGGGTYDAKTKGLFEANDLTVNFNKYGNFTKNADAYLPYLNAAVQGLDQIGRMYTQGGASRLAQVYAKSIGALTIPTAVIYMLNHNDPNYQQVSNFIKDNYLLIPNGDGTFTKVAKPRELGMVFSTGVERALRAFSDHDPRAFQDFSNNFLQNFLPPGAGGAIQGYQQKGLAGIPGGVMQDTVAGPIMDLERNKNFANQPIVPQDLLTRSPSLQYDAKTSEPAKFLGNLLNSSPKQLDFLAKSYLGVIGQLGIPATTKGGSIGDTLKQQVTADPTFSNDISRNFYDQKTKADMAKVDAKASGIPQQQDLSAYYDRLAASFTKLRNQMKLVQNDDTMSNVDKRAKLKELQDNLNQIQLKATK